ncbi:MAG: peptide deformylase [Pseudomonadota bacterium]|nr:peptide deformylase [Pseudomonadota bacterium]
MSVLKILTIPDPRLKNKSKEVDFFDKKLQETVGNMLDTLYSSENGIGLAAPQVGINKRIVVIDLQEDGKKSPITFINPEVLHSSKDKATNEEGCLSIPGYYAEVERPKTVDVEWSDLKGGKIKKRMTGLLSVCIQHEIDHLNGILFIDHLSNLKRKLAYQKSKKLKKKKDEKTS